MLSVVMITAETAALRNELIATPVSSSVAMENLLPVAAMANTMVSAITDPMNAPMGNRNRDVDSPSAITMTAPSAPPADVPMMPGSAMGFRNMACMIVPAVASAAPTVRDSRMRGSRMVCITAVSVVLAVTGSVRIPIQEISASNVCEYGMLSGPMVSAVIVSAAMSASRMMDPIVALSITGDVCAAAIRRAGPYETVLR